MEGTFYLARTLPFNSFASSGSDCILEAAMTKLEEEFMATSHKSMYEDVLEHHNVLKDFVFRPTQNYLAAQGINGAIRTHDAVRGNLLARGKYDGWSLPANLDLHCLRICADRRAVLDGCVIQKLPHVCVVH